MKAVNLIPAHRRRGSSARARSGIGVYVFLGVLAAAVVMSAAYKLSTNALVSKQAQLAEVQQRATAAQDEIARLTAYSTFSNLRAKRAQTVQSIASSRVDWSHAMNELARVLPAGAWLNSIRATASPTSTVEGGVSNPLRAALNVPALELAGCTRGQSDVARVISAMRRVDGVTRVSLSSSTRPDKAQATSAGAASDAASADEGCVGRGRPTAFSLTVFLAAPAGAATTPAKTGATAAAGTTAAPPTAPATSGASQ